MTTHGLHHGRGTEMTSTPLGYLLNNPGNLRHSARFVWDGEVFPPTVFIAHGFCQFIDMFHGCRASVKNLQAKFREGLDTVEKIIGDPHLGWAPATENDTVEYVSAVCSQTAFGPTQELTPDAPTLYALAKAIFRVELGGHFVLDETIRQAVALLVPPRVDEGAR